MMGLEALSDVKQQENSQGSGGGYGSGGYGNSEKRSFGASSGEWGSERSSGRSGGNQSYGNDSYGNRSSGNQSYGGGSQSYGNRSGGQSYGGGGQSYGNKSGNQSYGNQQSPAARQSSSPGRPAGPPAKPRVLSRSGPQEWVDPAASSGIAPKADFERLKTGDQVMHTKFGVGVVAEVIGEGDKELYAVKFESAGKRVLDPRFAKLVKMN